MKIFFPCIVLLVANIPEGFSLKCYSMDEDNQLAIEHCPEGKDYCMTVMKSDGDNYVGCNTYGEIQEEGCQKDASMVVCFCDSDFCNGSNRQSLGSLLLLFSFGCLIYVYITTG